jgi:uncharacterized delta-60 repeat protein
MAITVPRPGKIRGWFSFIVLCMPLLAQAAFAPPVTPAMHPIAQADLNDIVSKQVQPGLLRMDVKPDGTYLLTNALQTVSAHVAADGVVFDSIGNSAGKGGFSLRLSQFGREGHAQVASSADIFSEGSSIFHKHPEGITEKFSNTAGGIRQDFIVDSSPEGSGLLHVQLQVSNADVQEKHNGALIQLVSGRQLTYDRLTVVDSDGKSIPARIAVLKNGTGQKNVIDITVNDADARYPLTIDPTVGDQNWVSMGGYAGTDSAIYAVATHGSDIYVGGQFSRAGGLVANNIAKWNGSAWMAMGAGVNSYVLALAVDSAGNVYAGGGFDQAGGTPANWIAKWNGSAWSALGSGMNQQVNALTVDNNDHVYAGGTFTTAGGTFANYVAKWDGSTWSPLDTSLDGQVLALTADNAGNIYAGGYFGHAGSLVTNGVAKWDGTAWSALGAGVNSGVYALAVDAGNNLYAGGFFTAAGGVSANYIAKWNGTAWSPLGTGMDAVVTALAVDGSGKVFASGNFSTAGSVSGLGFVAQWDGSNWSAMGAGLGNNAVALVNAGASVIAVGSFTTADSLLVDNIARWSGGAWTTVGDRGFDAAISSAVFDNVGNLYVGGGFHKAPGGVAANYIAKWNGSVWSALGAGVDNYVRALAVDSSGNLYAGGDFLHAGGLVANNVAEWSAGAWLPLDNGLGNGVNGTVSAIAADTSGNVYVGGFFTQAGGNSANRIAKWSGGNWFELGIGMDNAVYALAVDAAGTLYAAGDFAYAGLASGQVARWDGVDWLPMFQGADTNGSVYALAVDGANVYIGGSFTTVANLPAYNVARWNGTAWSAPGGGGVNGTVKSLALDNKGNLFAAGNFTYTVIDDLGTQGIQAKNAAFWNRNAWYGLGSGLNNAAGALAVSGDNTLYIGGGFTFAGDKYSNNLAQWNFVDTDNDGYPDFADAFPANPAEWLDTDGDGIGNNADPDIDNDSILNAVDNCPLGVNMDQLDSDNDGFGNVCDSTPYGLDVDADGVPDAMDNCPAVSNALQQDRDGDGIGDACDPTPLPFAGNVDSGFVVGAGADGDVYTSALQPDGKILIGGNFTFVNGVARARLARLNADGTVDSTFNPGGGADAAVRAIAVMNDGRILVGGDFTTFDGVSRLRYVRLNSDGSRDATASSGDVFNGSVNTIVIQPDGKTVIAGDFTTFRGVSSSRKRIVRLSVSGTVDGSFTTGLGADAAIRVVTLLPDGKLLIGGDFTRFHNTYRNNLMQLNSNGTVDTGFNSSGIGADGSVLAIVRQANGSLVIGGSFSHYNGAPRDGLMRVNSDGTVGSAFGSLIMAGGAVSAVVEQSDGKLVIAGNFTSLNGFSRNRVARFNANDTLDAGFYPDTGANAAVYTASLQANGKLLLGGAFTVFFGVTSNHLASIQTGDTDGDGVDDAVDAFPTNDAAAADYDHDGIPDAWLQPNPYGCLPSDASCNGLTITPDPPNVIYPLNGVYKGSSVREFHGWQ